MSRLIACLFMIAYHSTSDAAKHRPWPPSTADKLVKLLDAAISSHHNEGLDRRIQPLVILLRYMARLGPGEAREHIVAQLLPSEEDRTQVLGQGNSLPHRLVKFTTETASRKLKALLAWLLLELSGRDTRRLAHNV